MKCITTHKKLKKLGYFGEKMTCSHYVPILPPIPPKNLAPLLMKFMFWNEQNLTALQITEI